MQNKFVALISRIKEHLVAFLGRKSLQLLWFYIDGYLYAIRQEEFDCDENIERRKLVFSDLLELTLLYKLTSLPCSFQQSPIYTIHRPARGGNITL